jgi:hypothetical protein
MRAATPALKELMCHGVGSRARMEERKAQIAKMESSRFDIKEWTGEDGIRRRRWDYICMIPRVEYNASIKRIVQVHGSVNAHRKSEKQHMWCDPLHRASHLATEVKLERLSWCEGGE